MTDATPRFDQAPASQGLAAVQLHGEWTAAQFARPRLVRELRGRLPQASEQQAWDLRPAGRLDHVGAQLLWDHWGRRWPQALELLPAQRAVLERVAEFTVDRPLRPRTSWW
ncbi:MAG: ABC transporter permease, partial [Comamonadaceae bacterium]